MRAAASKSTENKWVGVDVNYNSPIWEERVAASEVFIVPTAISGTGTRTLLSIATQGHTEFTVLARQLSHDANLAQQDYTHIQCSCVVQLAQRRNAVGDDYDQAQERARAQQIVLPFEVQAVRMAQAHRLAEHLIGKFEQLSKVAQSVLTEQEDRGDQLTQTEDGVKKLTVGMKCVDNVWAEITQVVGQLKKLSEQISKSKVFLAPPAREAYRVEQLESGEGEEKETQHVVIFDPTSILPEKGPFRVHTTTEGVRERGEGEVEAERLGETSEANSQGNNDERATFVEAFEQGCTITRGEKIAVADPGNQTEATNLNTDDASSLPDTLHDEEELEVEGPAEEAKQIQASRFKRKHENDKEPEPEDVEDGNEEEEDESESDVEIIVSPPPPLSRSPVLRTSKKDVDADKVVQEEQEQELEQANQA